MEMSETAAELEVLRGQVRDLKSVLKQDNRDLMLTFRLPPRLGNILGLLLSTSVVTQLMIEQRMGLATCAKVAIHRLRKHLKPYGIDVPSQRGLGYWLEKADKAKIAAMVRETTGEMVATTQTPEVAPQGHTQGHEAPVQAA